MDKKILELDADAVDTLLTLLRSMSDKSLAVIQEMQERGEKEIELDFAMQTAAVVSLYKHLSKANKKFEVAELEKLFALDETGENELDLGLDN